MTPDAPDPQEPKPPVLNYQTPVVKEPEQIGCLVMAILAAFGVGALWLFGVMILASDGPPAMAAALIGGQLAVMALLLAKRKRFATIALLIVVITGITLLLTMGICAVATPHW